MPLTTNEAQELKYLEVFITNKIGKFSSMTYPQVLIDAMGNGAYTIVQNFMRDGVIADLYNQEYEFTEVGKNRYKILKAKKCYDRIANIAFWIIFACTLIAAGDVIIKWSAKSPSKPLSTESPTQKIGPKASSPSQLSAPDSTKGLHTDPSQKAK